MAGLGGGFAPVEEPSFVAALFGKVSGKEARSILVQGRRDLGWSSTSAYGDVANYLDTSQPRINDVVLGTTYYLRSSSASDAAAGTGARTVRIYYLDGSGVLQAITATLNGTTGVSLGNAISYIEAAEVASAGSTEAAVGNITISSVAGAPTTAQTVEFIPANQTQSRSARYKIPTGFDGYLQTWAVSAIGQSQDMVLRAKVFTGDRTPSTVFHAQDGTFLPGSTSGGELTLHWLKCPEGTEIKVSSIPGASGAGNRADVTVHLLLVER
jgi:hypothetical protein